MDTVTLYRYVGANGYVFYYVKCKGSHFRMIHGIDGGIVRATFSLNVRYECYEIMPLITQHTHDTTNT